MTAQLTNLKGVVWFSIVVVVVAASSRTGTTFEVDHFILCKDDDDDEKKKLIHTVQSVLSQATMTEDDHIKQRKLR